MATPRRIALILTGLAAVLAASPARSETAEDFFKGKQISLIIGYNPGGPYDVYGRLVATILPRYIPGQPSIVPRNMPGVGSAKAANYLYGQASRDGLTIGMVGQQLAVTQAVGDPAVEYDMRKFNWLGRLTSGGEVSIVWHTAPVRTIADATARETTLAATSAGSASDSMPLLMNRLAGTKFKMVKGYPGITGTVLAMERGETDGAHSTVEQLLFGKQDWLREKKIAVLVQYSQARHPAFKDVPAMVEFGKTAEDKQILALFGSTAEIGRSMLATPEIPADRFAVLRKAFATMLADPAFRQEVEKRNLEVDPLSGEALQQRISETLAISPEVAKRAMELSRE
jgi:tripartite-type tricarboxylate transporter receptor subunit TctC